MFTLKHIIMPVFNINRKGRLKMYYELTYFYNLSF